MEGLLPPRRCWEGGSLAATALVMGIERAGRGMIDNDTDTSSGRLLSLPRPLRGAASQSGRQPTFGSDDAITDGAAASTATMSVTP